MILVAGLVLGLPQGAAAQLKSCSVGDRVASPAGHHDKWLQSVVVKVDPASPFPCRVHPLGYAFTMEESFKPSMLKAMGAIQTEPVGGMSNDPYLLTAQGKQAFKPSSIVPGSYECYALSSGRLSPRLALNFAILDGSNYRDFSGAAGTYRFDAASGGLVFNGAALAGQRATYAQPSNPPTRNAPPAVTFAVSGDTCDLKI